MCWDCPTRRSGSPNPAPSRVDIRMKRNIHVDPALIQTHGIGQEQIQRVVDTATAKFSDDAINPLLIDFCLERAAVRVAVQKVNDHLEVVVIPSPEKSLVGG